MVSSAYIVSFVAALGVGLLFLTATLFSSRKKVAAMTVALLASIVIFVLFKITAGL